MHWVIKILTLFPLTLLLYSLHNWGSGVHNFSLLLHAERTHLAISGSDAAHPSSHTLGDAAHPSSHTLRRSTPSSSLSQAVGVDASDHSTRPPHDRLHHLSCTRFHRRIDTKAADCSNEETLHPNHKDASTDGHALEPHFQGIEPFKSDRPPQKLGNGRSHGEDPGCRGKLVYIYKLPSEFNEDLVDRCGRTTDTWAPLCGNLHNNGFGPRIPMQPKAPNGSDINGLVDLDPLHAWYRTEQFSVELIFHERLRRGYPCITEDPEVANAFYIPYYGALDTAFTLFNPDLPERDRLAKRLVRWLSKDTVWTKFRGARRHFMVLGRIAWDFSRSEEVSEGWGSALLSQRVLSNVTKLLLEKRPWVSNEYAIPYPTSFHPSSPQDMQLWQEKLRGTMTQRRRLLCSLIGSTTRGTDWSRALRTQLVKQCDQVGTDICQEYKCGDGNLGTLDCARNPEHVSHLFLSSTFCLQPSGDSPTRKGIFDSLLAGCIPVLFSNSSAYTQYMWHLPKNGSLYSMFFDGDDVISGNVDIFPKLLRVVNDTSRLRRMQEEIIRILPQIVYAFPSTNATMHDAVDVALQRFLGVSSTPMI